MTLSGFFGLIATETSAGLIASGSVTRTTRWAVAELARSNKTGGAKETRLDKRLACLEIIMVFFRFDFLTHLLILQRD